ncbi:MAG: nuclear transport factor 2 family protein [Candidatus Sulfotelmatobacter sp.]
MPIADQDKRANLERDDKQQIEQLYQAGDQALMHGDLDALSRILADDYIQVDPTGEPLTKQAILASFRSGAIRYPSIVSTGRTIRIFGDTAVVHGSETDQVEAGGQRFTAHYMYLDVLMKRDGQWKLVASQLAKPANE